jgi:Flp pilus assembly protein CpaB
VPVATTDLPPGHQVGQGDVRWEDRPVAFLPAGGAVADDPLGRVVRAAVAEGEPLLAARLAPGGVEGPLALAQAGSRVVAVRAAPAWPPLAPGDRVDLLAGSIGGLERPRWVARRALVLVVDAGGGDGSGVATVAVEPAEAEATAAAALGGAVTPVLVVPG